MEMTKLEALRKAVAKLENPKTKYNWSYVWSCNCGILAQCILGVGEKKIIEYMKPFKLFPLHSWNVEDQYRCHTTGLPLSKVYEQMFLSGFSVNDIKEFEGLSNDKVLEVCGKVHKKVRKDVIAYLRAWISLLQEQHPKPEPTPTKRGRQYHVEVVRKVKVDEAIVNAEKCWN